MKKTMKTLLSAILASTLIFAGCSSGAGTAQSEAPSEPASSVQESAPESAASEASEAPESAADGETYEIGVVQIVDHLSLNTIRDAFVKEMEAQLGDRVNIECKDAQNDQSNLNSIVQKFVGDEKDLIVAIATPSAQAAAAATSEIPVLYSAVTDPEAAKLTGIPNVTGTSDAIPVESIFTLASKLTPDAKKFGLVYNTSEVNSVSVIEQAKEYMSANGYEFAEATITNTSELQQAASSLVGKVDAMFTPIDNTVASALAVIAGVCNENKIPYYVGADSMVSDGGLATVGIDYSVLGTRTAQMAAEVLGGKSPSDIPFEVMSDFSTILNTKTAETIGVQVPEDVLSSATLFDGTQGELTAGE